MAKEFNPDNSHETNVKISVDKILGQETTTRKAKRSADDHRRIAFCRIINNLLRVEERAIMLDEIHDLNLAKYEQPFFDVIEDLLALHFSKEQMKLINFFLYDRYSADGSLLCLTNNETGDELKLDSPEQLWEILKNVK
jgi:hypothetical protein